MIVAELHAMAATTSCLLKLCLTLCLPNISIRSGKRIETSTSTHYLCDHKTFEKSSQRASPERRKHSKSSQCLIKSSSMKVIILEKGPRSLSPFPPLCIHENEITSCSVGYSSYSLPFRDKASPSDHCPFSDKQDLSKSSQIPVNPLIGSIPAKKGIHTKGPLTYTIGIYPQ